MTLTEDHRDKNNVDASDDTEVDINPMAVAPSPTDEQALKLDGRNPLAEEERIQEDDTKAD